MKTSLSNTSKNTSKGFTLVEILVSIAILAILISIAVPVTLRLANKGKITKAKDVMKSLTTSFDLFRKDNNGMYPMLDSASTPNADGIIDTSVPTNGFIPALLGNSGTTNFKEIQYFEADQTTTDTDGVNTAGALFDPWGFGYTVCLDYDSNGQIDMANIGLPTECFFNTTGTQRENIIPISIGVTGMWEVGSSFWLIPGNYN